MINFFKKNKLKFKVMSVFFVMILILIAIFFPLMPRMFDYPAGTYNNDFLHCRSFFYFFAIIQPFVRMRLSIFRHIAICVNTILS